MAHATPERRLRRTVISTYFDGDFKKYENKYFEEIHKKCKAEVKDFQIGQTVTMYDEEKGLALLESPDKYIRQDGLISRLSESFKSKKKGVITILMERGTGKTSFVNEMDGLYTKKSPIKYCASRCYRISNLYHRSFEDFINVINSSFRMGIMSSIEELKMITMNAEDPGKEMSDFLCFYHSRVFAQKGNKYTVLIIDGIDELLEDDVRILNYIPSRDMLEEGVFVVLLSRYPNEDTVSGVSKAIINRVINVKRRTLGGVFCELISAFLPTRSCRVISDCTV